MKVFSTIIFFAIIPYIGLSQGRLIQFVDPFIGTEGGGNVFPGAATPFGMVKLGPDCGNKTSPMGYEKGAIINGFSHVHNSGIGGGPKYGNVLVMPTIGKVKIKDYGSYGHLFEASPGLFSVFLKRYDIQVDLTVSHSVGFHQYTFPQSDSANILIDAGSFLGEIETRLREAQEIVGSEIEIVGDTVIKGYTRVRGGWNQGNAYTIYFYALFNHHAKKYGIWENGKLIKEKKEIFDAGNKSGAFFSFQTKKGEKILLKVGISYISVKKAKYNLYKEIPHWSFEKVKNNAQNTWEEKLHLIETKGLSNRKKTIFYTALYHTLLMPTKKTGENPLWKSSKPYYDDYYAIWDTYRATSPLLTLIAPNIETEIVNSLLNIYEYEGYMPDARSGNITGRTQGGSNSDMVVADAYLKGMKGIDYELAYKAMITNAELPPGGNQRKQGRGGLLEYIRLGYIPIDSIVERTRAYQPKLYERAGSRTLEYATNDWAIAQVARGLGKENDYTKYKKRASNWANIWNGNIKSHGSKGFIWPKNKEGEWLPEYDLFKNGSWGNFLYQSHSWEYSLDVPQDMKSLIDSCGGKSEFINRLDTFFENNYFQITNEPGFLTPCLYLYANKPSRTQEIISLLCNKFYTDKPNGLPGNDDAGSMSAWYIWQTIGFYPVTGQDVYLITSPSIPYAEINIGDGKKIKIYTQRKSEKDKFIQSVTLNGKEWNKAWFRHNDIIDGAIFRFTMSDHATPWGTKSSPPSMSDNN